jgi:hypothetical protein
MAGASAGIAARPGTHALPHGASVLLYRLTLCLPLIFVLGTSSLFVTRYIYWLYHPEEWVGTLPSISGTASEPPASTFFLAMMVAAALCIVISWSLALGMYLQRLRLVRQSDDRARLAMLSVAACGTGMVAGLSLGALAIVSLRDGHDFHIDASYAFFISQVLSFLLEGACAVAVRRACPGLDGPVERRAVRVKLIAGLTILVCALFFLFMYHVRDYLAPASLYPAQQIYVASEYVVALLCFAYPLTAFAEIRRHYRLASEAQPRAEARRG